MTELKAETSGGRPSSAVKQPDRARAAKGRRILLQLVIFVALIALVGYGFTRYVLAPVGSSSVPEYVGSLGITNRVEGQEAETEINKLHGTDITLKNAYIAQYSGRYGGAHLQVWVGETGSPAEAQELIQRMAIAINKGTSPFSNPREETVAGRKLWQTDGPDGSFFFYESQELPTRVVWLSIEHTEGTTEAILASALKVF